MSAPIVLAYAGGFDTSVAIRWLAEQHGTDVVTMTLDLGQGRDLGEIRDRALQAGALRAHVMDVREEFARDYILPALQAGALYEGRYPLATALGRPLIARKLVEVAGIEHADTVAHGCGGHGNDRVRIDRCVGALSPALRVVAPARDWGISREQELEYARRFNVPIPLEERAHTIDANLWGRSIAGGRLEDTWAEPPEDIFAVTKAAPDAPATAADVEIAFERGVPVAINGVAMSPTEVIESLSIIAGQHGVGRIDMVENAVTGGKTREIYEAPAAVVLHAARKALETLLVPRDLERLTRELSGRYADLVYNGLWFTTLREALDAFHAVVQQQVTGLVRVRLFKGQHTITGMTTRQMEVGALASS